MLTLPAGPTESMRRATNLDARPSLSLSLSLSCITRVAPHCVNRLMILHVAHSIFLRPRAEGGGSLGLSPGVGEHIIAEVDAGRRHIIRQVIASVENGKWVAGKNSQLTWHRKTTWHGAPNTRAESARVLCARACLPAPRGLALPVREPVPTDYSRTSCCCSSSRLTIEYDGVRGCARW